MVCAIPVPAVGPSPPGTGHLEVGEIRVEDLTRSAWTTMWSSPVDDRVPSMPGKLRKRAPRVIRRDDGTDAWLVEGNKISTFGLNAVQDRPREDCGKDPGGLDEVRPGCYDLHQRVREMDVNGVLASLNLPSPRTGGEYFPRQQHRLRGRDHPGLQQLGDRRVGGRLPRVGSSRSPSPDSCSARTGRETRCAGLGRRLPRRILSSGRVPPRRARLRRR